jgi:ATP-dependent Lon protease
MNDPRALKITKDRLKLGRNTLVYGRPGTGKTKICRTFAYNAGIPFSYVNVKSIASEYRNGSVLLLQEKIEKGMAMIESGKTEYFAFIIDELEGLVNTDFTGDRTGESMRLLKTFDMYTGIGNQRQGAVFLATANDIGRIPATVRQRFSTMEMTEPTIEDVTDFLGYHLGIIQEGSEIAVLDRKKLDIRKVVKACRHQDGSVLVGRDFANMFATIVTDITDDYLNGKDHMLDSSALKKHIRAYVGENDYDGKKGFV